MGILQGVRHFTGSFLNKVAAIVENKGSDIWEYGEGNKLPNELLLLTQDSPTAAKCLEIKTQFIAADGFSDEAEAEFKVNANQTADELLDDLAGYEATFTGHALIVKYDPRITGRPFDLSVQEFDKVTKRRKAPGGEQIYLLNPLRCGETGYQKSHNLEVPEWNPARTDRARIYRQQYKDYGQVIGEIVYVFDKKPGQQHYPIPAYYAGDWDLKTDAEYSFLEFFKARNDFDASVLITTPRLDDAKKLNPSTGKKDLPSDAEAFGETLSSFTSKAGRERRRSIAWLELERPEDAELTQIKPLNIQESAGMGEKRTGVEERVARLMDVPGVLVGLYKPGSLGDSKKIADEIALFNSKVNRHQRRIQRTFQRLYPDREWNISTLNPINFVPEWLLAKLTEDEIRNLGGFEPLTPEQKAERQAMQPQIQKTNAPDDPAASRPDPGNNRA